MTVIVPHDEPENERFKRGMFIHLGNQYLNTSNTPAKVRIQVSHMQVKGLGPCSVVTAVGEEWNSTMPVFEAFRTDCETFCSAYTRGRLAGIAGE